MDINEKIASNANLETVTTTETYEMELSTYIKLFLGIVIIGFLAYNLYNYYYFGVDIFGNTIEDEAKHLAKNTKNVAKKATKSIKKTVKNAAHVAKETSAIHEENELDNALKHRKYNERVSEPDNSNSVIQKKNSKFCYIGSENNKRSCIEIGDSEKCMSGKIFPTKELCINPKLRV